MDGELCGRKQPMVRHRLLPSSGMTIKMKAKDSEILISFIMPVYNGEKCIRTALKSVLQEQTISLEIIVIDDGSEDDTPQILREAAEKEARLLICRTENKGQGGARNIGLDKAKGKYIFFLDADDTVIWTGIRQLVREAESGCRDIVCGNYRNISGGTISEGFSGADSGEVIRNNLPGSLYQRIKNESVFGYCWNKLYRREFLQLHRLQMIEEKYVYMEDNLFNLEVFCHNPRYYYLNVPVYNYMIRPGSTSHRKNDRLAENCSRMQYLYGQYLEENHCRAENQDLFVPLAMRQFCWIIFNAAGKEDNSRKKLKERISVFIKDIYFREMIENRQNRKYLQQVVSPVQRATYLWCFNRLNRGQYNSLTAVFRVLFPFMRIYAKRWRKI